MLEITFNGQQVELDEGTKITFVMRGNVFNFDKLEGSYSVPVSVPLSIRNKNIFGFPYKPDKNSNEKITGDTEIKFNGLTIISGTLLAEQTDKYHLEITIMADNGSFYQKISGKTLPEMEYGDSTFFELPSLNTAISPNTDYVLFPVKNLDFYKNTFMQDYFDIYQGVNPGELDMSYQNPIKVDGSGNSIGFHDLNGEAGSDYPIVITPFPILRKVVSTLIAGLGFSFNDLSFDDFMKRLCIFNVNSNVVHFYEDYESGGQSYTRSKYRIGGGYNHKDYLPNILVSELIMSIQNTFNVFFHVNKHKISLIDRSEIYKQADFTDLTDELISIKTKKIKGKADGWIIEIKRDGTDSRTGLPVFINNEESVISEVNPGITVTDTDIDFNTIGFSEGIYIYDNDSDNTVTSPTSGSWTIESTSYNALNWIIQNTNTVGSNERNILYQNSTFKEGKEIRILMYCSSITDYEEGHDDNAGADVIVPEVAMRGNMSSLTEHSDFGLRFAYLQNVLVNTEFGDDTPIGNAGATVASNTAHAVSAQYSYHKYWKGFLTWFTNIDAEFDIYLDLSHAQISNFDFTKKYKIENDYYFIRDIEVTFGSQNIGTVKATAFRA